VFFNDSIGSPLYGQVLFFGPLDARFDFVMAFVGILIGCRSEVFLLFFFVDCPDMGFCFAVLT